MILPITIAILLVAIIFLIQFYRDPKRDIPGGKNIVSPADGTVMAIELVEKNTKKITKGWIGKIHTKATHMKKPFVAISIFMSPINAHINRAPADGTIIAVKHNAGKFYKAYDLSKSFENEHSEIILDTRIGTIQLYQIAGFLARRVITRVKKGDKVNKGQKIGQIALGSQATLFIPADKITVQVKKGDTVYAGSSVLAEIK